MQFKNGVPAAQLVCTAWRKSTASNPQRELRRGRRASRWRYRRSQFPVPFRTGADIRADRDHSALDRGEERRVRRPLPEARGQCHVITHKSLIVA